MVRTYGLGHIGLRVASVERSFRFYRDVFGAREIWRGPGEIQFQTPGCRDVVALEETKGPRQMGGVTHFGFRLGDAKDLDAAVAAVKKAGGTVLERGEFVPGEPYAFVKDPDGYRVEIWYE
ncbi:MAG TPA: VOC family protein [Thermoplasmata archaeon]|nr:VOC family protein [Thermoplasmata archaeon]